MERMTEEKKIQSLQATSFIEMWDHLNGNVQEEVKEHILSDMTLDEILNHPVVVEGYKRHVLQRDRLILSDNKLVYMLSHSKDAKLFRNMYQGFHLNNVFINVTRCYMRKDSLCVPHLVLIDDYWDQKTNFDLSEFNVEKFDFDFHIKNSNIPMENVYRLKPNHYISNPQWFPNSNLSQTIPGGQKEIVWWTDFLTDYYP